MAAVPVTFQGVLFFSDVGIGGGPMPGGPSVSHPIAPGGLPPGIWGGPPLYPDQGLPGQQPGIWPSPGHPSHPIAPGGQPPGIWPSPGHPSHPIVIPPSGLAPGIPSHPIYWPIEPPTGPSAPGEPPTPTHPIVIPGDDENNPKFEVKAAWTPQTGWVTVIIPTGETTVTPA